MRIKQIAGSFVVYAEASLFNIIQQLTASRLYEKFFKKTRMSARLYACFFLKKFMIPGGYHKILNYPPHPQEKDFKYGQEEDLKPRSHLGHGMTYYLQNIWKWVG